MDWNLEEALRYYQRQGAPSDQTALISLLREVQQESGDSIPLWVLRKIAESYRIRESFLQAIIKRIPALRLENTHTLELCCGPNCGKRDLLTFVEKTYGKNPKAFTLKCTGCMRMCGKGPNCKWDGVLYHNADEALIRRLIETSAE